MNRSTAAAVAFATAAAFPAFAENNALDGRSFEGVFLERGKTAGDADTLVFRNGRFRSIACDRYGYSDAPYKTAALGDSTRFEAQTESAKYRKAPVDRSHPRRQARRDGDDGARRQVEHRELGRRGREEMSHAHLASHADVATELKHFGKPDEVREFPKGRVELIQIGGATIGRAVFEPGWRWATSVQPIAKTKSCEAPHFQYHVSGVLRIRMDDGQEFDCKAGDVSLLPAGHDAWVVGNDPAVVVDFQGMLDYAKGGG